MLRTVPEYQRLLQELEQWCKRDRGRQHRLAQALNVSDATISSWVHGRREMSLRQWIDVKNYIRRGIVKREQINNNDV